MEHGKAEAAVRAADWESRLQDVSGTMLKCAEQLQEQAPGKKHHDSTQEADKEVDNERRTIESIDLGLSRNSR